MGQAAATTTRTVRLTRTGDATALVIRQVAETGRVQTDAYYLTPVAGGSAAQTRLLPALPRAREQPQRVR